MRTIFPYLGPADYTFLAEVIRSPFNVHDDALLVRRAAEYEQSESEEALVVLQAAFEDAIRYLGSSELAYHYRRATVGEGGVSFRLIVEDVARVLGVRVRRTAPVDEMVADLAATYATVAFGKMDRESQQQMLTELGIDHEQAARFLRRSAGVFAIPVLLQAFNAVVVEALIKRVIFGAIARFIGSRLAGQLFAFLAGRLPWWVNWVGPVAWAGSIGWTATDLQGPAYRKTVPVVLYLGLCVVRDRGIETVSSFDR
jgi:uncharacterized protein YaaW (UPF0174 family)